MSGKRSRKQGDRRGGPKSAEGKAVVRLNPVKHGVLSQTPVLPLVEREEDWERLRQGIMEDLEVTGALEEALAERIAQQVWRLARSSRAEVEAIDSYMREVPRDWRLSRASAGLPIPDELTPEIVGEMDRMLMERLMPGNETLEKLMQYETKIHRFLLQTLHQFMVVKELRKPGGRQVGLWDSRPRKLEKIPRRAGRVPRVIETNAERRDGEGMAPEDEQAEG